MSSATRARILAAAEELGYRRNASMGMARSGKFNALGLSLSTHPNHSRLTSELLKGLNEGVRENNLHRIVQELPDSPLTEVGFVPKILREWMCDGLLIDYIHNLPSELLELVRKNNTPAVWNNTKLEAETLYRNSLNRCFPL